MASPQAALSSQIVVLPYIPQLYDPHFLDALLPSQGSPSSPPSSDAKNSDATSQNPLMQALETIPARAVTDNGAAAYSTSTLSSTLKAFYQLSHSSGDDIGGLLNASWKESPDLTLRLIWNLRSIHDGKSEKEAFYRAFGWLYHNHPRTAIANLHLLVEPVIKRKNRDSQAHGYWKDLLNIVALACLNQSSLEDSEFPAFLHPPRTSSSRRHKATRRSSQAEHRGPENPNPDHAKQARQTKNKQLHLNLEKKLLDPRFCALYVAVARLFADRLLEDIEILDKLASLPKDASEYQELIQTLSLAGKWAPTPGASHDRVTNLSSAIAQLLHHAQPSVSLPSFSLKTSLSHEDTHTLRVWYQRQILTSLRKATAIPEPLMATNHWKAIKYSRVSSVCMQRNMSHFYKHDQHGFESYMIGVEQGKRGMSGAALMPHELVGAAFSLYQTITLVGGKKKADLEISQIRLRVVEAQWKTLINRLREEGSIENSLAICDVSGSMGYISGSWKGATWKSDVMPILPAVALSLVLSLVSKPPFANGFITFSRNPKFVRLDPSLSLGETVEKMVQSDWGMNTDFEAVFLRLLLPLAVENKVSKEDMVKRLFVFSDMQFDDSRGQEGESKAWQTTYERITNEFAKAGYDCPEIVFWNLAGDRHSNVPTQGKQPGVALMSGFSSSMLKVFLGEEEEEEEEEWEKVGADGEEEQAKREKEKEEITPEMMMKRTLERESYNGLVVLD